MLKDLKKIILTFLLCSCVNQLFAAPVRPSNEKQLAHKIYQQFVNINSGFTTGATTPVVNAAVAQLKAEGFTDDDIFIGGPIPSKQNLVVRYRGTGTLKPILLLAHLDVVEATRSDWSKDPFHLVEENGYFYGRGTVDDKAQAAIWIANLIQYKREGFKPNRDIIVALTADEEGGGPYNGITWLLKHHANLIHAEYALNEGGAGELLAGKRIANHIQVSEKYILNFNLEVRNPGGHSSLPVADNAIYRLADALNRLNKLSFPLKTNAVTANYFRVMAKDPKQSLHEAFAKVANNNHAAMVEVANASPFWNAMLRTTCIPTRLQAGHATNALPQQAIATINCRVLPEDNPEMVQKAIHDAINDDHVSITIKDRFERSKASPLRNDIVNTVTRLTSVYWPYVQTMPAMVTGATDGRYLRSAGIPTYGISALFFDFNTAHMHGRDEHLSVQSFYESQAFLYELVKQLAQK